MQWRRRNFLANRGDGYRHPLRTFTLGDWMVVAMINRFNDLANSELFKNGNSGTQ
jgi:hypothetical protein